jgi:hypothetical protein
MTFPIPSANAHWPSRDRLVIDLDRQGGIVALPMTRSKNRFKLMCADAAGLRNRAPEDQLLAALAAARSDAGSEPVSFLGAGSGGFSTRAHRRTARVRIRRPPDARAGRFHRLSTPGRKDACYEGSALEHRPEAGTVGG